MAFELPFPPFPHDSRDVPFIATPDDNNGYAVPSSQYFKKLVGEKHLWTPVSSDDPMPSSDVAAQAQLAEILAKLSADPATQTTLAAILAKLITAPATEAKQTALNALIGEVQAAPTANTLLARLKNLETKVDAIIADGLKLSGSNAVLLKEYIANNQFISSTGYTCFGSSITTLGSSATMAPLDVSKYKNKFIKIRNGYDIGVKISFYVFKQAILGSSHLDIILLDEILAAGASKTWCSDTVAKLTAPYVGLVIALYASTQATTGSVDVFIMGGAC